MYYILTAVAASASGLVCGFVISKKSTRWCPTCGSSLVCRHTGGRHW